MTILLAAQGSSRVVQFNDILDRAFSQEQGEEAERKVRTLNGVFTMDI